MTNKLLKISVVIFWSLSFMKVQSQENINASGGDVNDSGGSVSYSVGQVFYTFENEPKWTLTQGVQQTYDIVEETEIKGAELINLSVVAYPNPTTDYLTLSIVDFDISDLSYQLYDINGKILQNKKISKKQTNIVMSNLVPAVYFVKITNKSELIKTFKIIKK